MFKKSKIILTASLLLSLAACGSGVVTAPSAPILGDVTPQAFIVGSPYPADIDIVNQAGLENVAFITTGSSVLVADLTTNPISPSSQFVGLPSLPAEDSAGFPNNLEVVDPTHAFLLTSDAVIYFNPTDGSVYETLPLLTPIALNAPLAQVASDGSPLSDLSGSFTPSLPASLVVNGSQLAINFSNIDYSTYPATYTQGIVQFYDIHASVPYLTPASTPYVATSGFNTTGLTLLSDGNILVTNTGVTQLDYATNSSIPLTPGSVDQIDFSTYQITDHLDLGMTAPAFRSWALTPDGQNAFIGSSSGGYVLEMGLSPLSIVHGEQDPIVITSAQNGTDFLSDVLMKQDGGGFFVASSNHSTVYAVDLTTAQPTLLANPIDLSLAGNLGITGAGPMALRPGNPGADFTGPDLFVLTANPGTVAAIKTY